MAIPARDRFPEQPRGECGFFPHGYCKRPVHDQRKEINILFSRQDPMDTPAAPTPTSPFFTALRTRLHYVDRGNSAAPALLLVHGGFDHARSWDWTARALCGDYHVMAVDLRGHGDSGWSSDGGYMMSSFVYD